MGRLVRAFPKQWRLDAANPSMTRGLLIGGIASVGFWTLILLWALA
jgi:hypothetical protein